ncbi:hypothetical protein E2542_SST21967 [Spatholobus suberectus]|nr:hypothetical protein E2542_SST21967 [Spatholobus suberectus]
METTLRNRSEERRTCLRWLSSYLTGESATTWRRLTRRKFLTKSLKSISTRMEDMEKHGGLLIKMLFPKKISGVHKRCWRYLPNVVKASESSTNSTSSTDSGLKIETEAS